MQILLAAATELEIAPYIKSHPSADVLITGVGATVTVYHLTKRMQQIDYDLVIQAGIAGSFNEQLPPGEVVLIKKDCFADVGISEQNMLHTVFEKRFADENVFPFKKGWLENDDSFLNAFSLKKVNGITINTVTDNRAHIQQLYAKFGAAVETMEGAALHYTCLNEHIPFLQLRAISNFVGERDKEKWNMKAAVENLNAELVKIMAQLTAARV